jgi:acyl dehydratase
MMGTRMTIPGRYPPHGFDDLELGKSFQAGPRVISRDDIDLFALVSGDQTALHTDEAYARTTPLGGLVAHGALSLAAATGLAYETGAFEGTVLAFRSMDIRFERPVRPDDSVSLTLRVQELDPKPRPERGRITLNVLLCNQDGRTVLSGHWTLLLRREANSAG